ncbi:MAG: DNA replication/repair protein RecF [Rickettsiales bacterium]|nr:DNA replication/repair protein RecF [Rickettsiales bacterium]
MSSHAPSISHTEDGDTLVRQASTSKGYAVTALALTQFRNIAYMELAPGQSSVIITGPNGSGKTTILEAISLLAPGRGLRGARLIEIDRQRPKSDGVMQHTPWAVAAEVTWADALPVRIGTGRDPSKGEDRRAIRIDGIAQRGQTILDDFFAYTYLTPQISHVFLEGTTARRAYLDRLVTLFHAEHPRHLAIYDHARSERRRLLAQSRWDIHWLCTLEQRLAEQAVAIAAARLDTLTLLEDAMREHESVFPQALLAVEGEVEQALAEGKKALAVEMEFLERQEASRSEDAQTGRMAYGPHRSDFRVQHAGKQMPAELCSTGEQKALLLALTLSSARARQRLKGIAPVLLLDEVVAHLDHTHRRALFAEILALGAQCWLTGTDPSLFSDFPEDASILTVVNGEVSG